MYKYTEQIKIPFDICLQQTSKGSFEKRIYCNIYNKLRSIKMKFTIKTFNIRRTLLWADVEVL